MLKTKTLAQLADLLSLKEAFEVARLDTLIQTTPIKPYHLDPKNQGKLLNDCIARLKDLGVSPRTGEILKACRHFELQDKEPLDVFVIQALDKSYDLKTKSAILADDPQGEQLNKIAAKIITDHAIEESKQLIDAEPEYYIAGEHDDPERGFFAVICSHYIDGNIADVYGETRTDANDQAQHIVDLLNYGVNEK